MITALDFLLSSVQTLTQINPASVTRYSVTIILCGQGNLQKFQMGCKLVNHHNYAGTRVSRRKITSVVPDFLRNLRNCVFWESLYCAQSASLLAMRIPGLCLWCAVVWLVVSLDPWTSSWSHRVPASSRLVGLGLKIWVNNFFYCDSVSPCACEAGILLGLHLWQDITKVYQSMLSYLCISPSGRPLISVCCSAATNIVSIIMAWRELYARCIAGMPWQSLNGSWFWIAWSCSEWQQCFANLISFRSQWMWF